MNDDFAILAQFLESLEPEVCAHSARNLSDDQKDLIRKFAGGNLSDEDREALLPELLDNENALTELVSLIQSQNQ